MALLPCDTGNADDASDAHAAGNAGDAGDVDKRSWQVLIGAGCRKSGAGAFGRSRTKDVLIFLGSGAPLVEPRGNLFDKRVAKYMNALVASKERWKLAKQFLMN